MFTFNQYVRAQSLDEAYELYQKKNNVVLGGMLWLKMQPRNCMTAIDLCELGLDRIEETETEFRIGAYVSLRELETSKALNEFTDGAMSEAMKHIVGVQFRNVATLGGSIWGRFGFSDVLTVFDALHATVELHHAGLMDMESFKKMDRTQRDILVAVHVPKTTTGTVYQNQRNNSTDFPVLTCCVSRQEKEYTAVIGATPMMAREVRDKTGILTNLLTADEVAAGQMAADFGEYVSERVIFGSNSRAGADYRKMVCKVLVKRAVLESREHLNSSKEKGAENPENMTGEEK